MLLSLFQWIVRPIFGTFEKEEFKKFLRLGLIFAMVIGVYWTLRAMKKAVLLELVDKFAEPYAKTLSLICLIPLLLIYNKLLNHYSREKMFGLLAFGYGACFLAFGILLLFVQASPEVMASRTGFAMIGTKAVGYGWYVLTEMFGSLVPALFWAIASDTTSPDSAKKGFYFVTALTQVGGWILPGILTTFPRLFHFTTGAVVLFCTGLLTLCLYPLMKWYFRKTPKNLLETFRGTCEREHCEVSEPGFFEGLKLMIRERYLLSIFLSIAFFEIIVTIFDFNFGRLAASTYSGAALAEYFGRYASRVNLVALICLFLGVGNITRYLGIRVALVLLPLILGLALFGFLTMDSLNFLFWLMVSSKAINYALNGPAQKQLYIPISKDARYKAQSWCECFGSRGAKQTGSLINMSFKPLAKKFGEVAGRAKYIAITGYLGFGLIAVWVFVALYLGNTYNRAIREKKLVC